LLSSRLGRQPEPESEAFSSAESTRKAEDKAEPESKLHGRRSRTEMMLDILESVKEGAEGPTRIMYRANLSWPVLQGLLKRLVQRELVKPETDGARRRYEITPRGLEVLYHRAAILNEVEETETRWCPITPF
jgi:predicted transcriptional regulator